MCLFQAKEKSFLRILLSGKGGPSLWTTFHRLKQVHQKIYNEDIRARPELLKLAESFKSLETNREQAELNRLTLEEINTFLTNPNLGKIIVGSKIIKVCRSITTNRCRLY